MSWNNFFNNLPLLLFLVQHPPVEIRNVKCWSHAMNHGSGVNSPPSVSSHTDSPGLFSFPLSYMEAYCSAFFPKVWFFLALQNQQRIWSFSCYIKLSAPYTSKCLGLMASFWEWPHSWSHWRLKMYVWLLEVLVVPSTAGELEMRRYFLSKNKIVFVKLQWLSWPLSFP